MEEEEEEEEDEAKKKLFVLILVILGSLLPDAWNNIAQQLSFRSDALRRC